MSKFSKDLETGHKYEKKCLEYLDYDEVEHMEGYFKEYDLIITKDGKKTKIEVKSDKQASLTGNLAIEYECNNKPSGITSTTADYWIYFIIYNHSREECYKIPTKELRKIVKKCKKVSGGDGERSRLYLIKKSLVKDYLINLISEKNDVNYIQPTMNNQEHKTDEVKPMSYSQRLIQAFLDKAEKNDDSFSMDDIKEQIEAFSKQEYEKRKEKTDEMPFGKYKFKKVSEVAKFDKQYLKWLSRQDMLDKYEELREEINKHIK